MKAVITIQMDNAAFEDSNGDELFLILRSLEDSIWGCQLKKGDTRTLRDSNGNTVGQMVIKK
jgi:uncharacterized protein YxjI